MKISQILFCLVLLSGFVAQAKTIRCVNQGMAAAGMDNQFKLTTNPAGGARLEISGVESLVFKNSYPVRSTIYGYFKVDGRDVEVQGLMGAEVPRVEVLGMMSLQTRRAAKGYKSGDLISVDFDRCFWSKTNASIGSCYVTKDSVHYGKVGIGGITILKRTSETSAGEFYSYVVTLLVNSGASGVDVELPSYEIGTSILGDASGSDCSVEN